MVYIDLFAGAGGLSEGFRKAGFTPVAHVEADPGACATLKTRNAFYLLSDADNLAAYYSYLRGEINRAKLYETAGGDVCSSVINEKIGGLNTRVIFEKIDRLAGDQDIDLIIGGPPCQAYSYIGRAAMKNLEKAGADDERKTLYKEYGKFLSRYRPKIFVFENVPGLLTAGNGTYLRNLTKYFRRIGYKLEVRQLNAHSFGVIQHRERLIIIGWRKDLHFSYPEFDLIENCRTREDIFSDLPVIGPNYKIPISYYSGDSNEYLTQTGIRNSIDFVTQHTTRPHNEADLRIYARAIRLLEESKRLKNHQIPEEERTQKNTKDFLDRFKVVDKKPHTMIAHIAKDGHHFIHPDINQLRSISVREAARIQSFPDNYFFESVKEGYYQSAAFKQIGNAVPPLMAYHIASQIRLKTNGESETA